LNSTDFRQLAVASAPLAERSFGTPC
jgi:hypothetical protein